MQLLIPVVCAFTYVLSALMLKRANALGVDIWRISFLANWALFLVFLPWWLMQTGASGHTWTDYWQPAANALFFLAGQMLVFYALQEGDVSVTTPVMGAKVLMVALLSRLLRAGEVPWPWWIAALLSAAAVTLLHFGEHPQQRPHVGRTVMLTGLSALSFSLCDVVLQKWVGAWGSANYLPAMFLFCALYTFVFVPRFRASLIRLDRRVWFLVGGGAALLAVTNAGIALAIAKGRAATSVNIIYSLRGLVSVVSVWAIGHWFASEEQHLSPRVLRARLFGAACMLGAILLVLL